MVLPALCLGTAAAANVARTTRSCMLDVLGSDYVRTALAKGLAGRAIVLKHALKNAMIPVVTVAGLQLGILLGGTVVVEEVFTLPGRGPPRPLVDLPARLPGDAEHDPVHRDALHGPQPGRRSVVRLPGAPHPVRGLSGREPARRRRGSEERRRTHEGPGPVRAARAPPRRGARGGAAARGRGRRPHGGERRLPQLSPRRRRQLAGHPAPDRARRRGLGDRRGGRSRRPEPQGRRPRDPLLGADLRALPLLRHRPAEPLREPPARKGRAPRGHHAPVARGKARLPVRPRRHLRLAHGGGGVERDPRSVPTCRSTARR